MRYGACNWVFGGEDLNTTAAFLAKAGFDGVELKGDLQLLRTFAKRTVAPGTTYQLLSILRKPRYNIAHAGVHIPLGRE